MQGWKWYNLILFFITFVVEGQEMRLTIDVSLEANNIQIVNLGKNGIITIYEKQARVAKSKNIRWNFSRIDTNLVEIWQNEKIVPSELEFKNHYQLRDKLYLLFGNIKEFQILEIELSTGEIFSYNGRMPKEKVEVSKFVVINNMAFLGGYVEPSEMAVLSKTCLSIACFPLLFVPSFIPEKRAIILSYSLSIKTNKKLIPEIKGASEVVDLVADTTNNLIKFLTYSKHGSKHFVQYYETGLYNSVLKYSQLKNFTDEYVFKSAGISEISKNQKIITGFFNKKSGGSVGARGVYFAGIENERQTFVQYQNFGRFSSFVNFFPDYERTRIMRKSEKYPEYTQDLNLNLNVISHKPIIIDSSSIANAYEFYQPQYHTEYRVSWYYGRPVDTPVEVFDGYRFSHFLVAKFNLKAEIEWDYTGSFKKILSQELVKKATFGIYKDKISIIYPEKDVIHYHISFQDSTLNTSGERHVDFEIDRNKVEEYIETKTEYWYNDYFLVFGKQKMLDYTSDYTKRRGYVLFINKHKF